MTDEPHTWRTVDSPFARIREQMKEMPTAVDPNGWAIREAAPEPAPVDAAVDPEPVPTGPKPDPSQGFQGGLSVPESANPLDRIRNNSRAAL